MIIIVILAVLGAFPVAEHGSSSVEVDPGGNLLLLDGETLSTEPGCGRNVVSSGGDLFWKECQPGEPQRIMRLGTGQVFSRDFFSGPFGSPSGDGFMISVPDQILLLDEEGGVTASFFTGEYPGSVCRGNGSIWFVSSRDGVLRKLNMEDGSIHEVPLEFTPLTVDCRDEKLLIESAEGTLFLCSSDGSIIHSIPGGFMPEFTGSDRITFCRWAGFEGCEATAWELVTMDLNTGREMVSPLERPVPAVQSGTDDPVAHFDVPYMHQRWDTPDWFNGSWSCGPTSCMMAVQYYDRLTPDSIWCSSPTGHWSQWGNYIPVEYTFLGHTYDILGVSPGGVWVPGAHGFICRDAGGAYWAYMELWMERHGLDSAWLGTSWSACTAQLDSGYPLVASTTSQYTSGHILLFNGYYSNHSVICNDAYGDQNQPGWGSHYNGKDVVYDWPGYNNGNVELGIAQLFSAQSEVLAEQGTLIDDRTHGYRKLGPCQYWHEQTVGYGGYSWWTYSTGALPDTCIVEWIPLLPSSGTYSVETWIPSSHATATGIYGILTASGWETVYLNQGSFSDQWVELGTWSFDQSTAMVRMGDFTGTGGQYISFDAVRFVQSTGVSSESESVPPGRMRTSMNPWNGMSALEFTLPEDLAGEILIYDLQGRKVAGTKNLLQPGTLSPGIYFAVAYCSGTRFSTRFTVME